MPGPASDSPLVIADVGGYTSYLRGVELEHAADVLSDLLGTVAEALGAVVPVAKIEGDAVFCAGGEPPADTTAVFTAVVDTYVAFRRRQRAISVATSCTCEACRRIPDLELKLVVHRGSFAVHEVAGRSEVVGPDVIVAHRLLKNSVVERTGLRGYALLTESAVLGLDPEGLSPHGETYEDVGEVAARIGDLESRWLEEEERIEVRVDPVAALIAHEAEVPVATPVAWRAQTDPAEQLLWRVGIDRFDAANPGGARGVGSEAHCVHGKTTIRQEILDWKPYRYLTYRERNPAGMTLWTAEFEPVGESRTRVRWLVALDGGTGQRLLVRLIGGRMRAVIAENFAALVAHLGGEAAGAPSV